MVVQTTLLESDLAFLELPHALEGTITKTVAQDLLKRMQELAVSLGQVPPAVVIPPAQPAGRLIGRTNVKPATKLAISRMRVVAVANLIDHKGSNLFVGTSTGTGSTTTCNTDLVEDCHPGILEEHGLLGRQLLVTKVDQGSPGVLDHATGATRGLFATFLEIAVFERRSSIDRGVSRKGKKCHKDRGNGGVHHGDNEVGGK
jgi:hypothetical protein